MSNYKSDWNEKVPDDSELGRAEPNFPIDRKGVPGHDGESDAEAQFVEE